jgi:hypothetical protein
LPPGEYVLEVSVEANEEDGAAYYLRIMVEYYQAVRSYREQGKVKQEVVHLGEHATADEALTAWEQDVRQLQSTRPRKADKLRAKMDRLKELTCQ